MMLLMEEGRIVAVDSPHGCGIEFSSVLCGIVKFLRKEVESGDKQVSNDESKCFLDDILTAQSDCLNQGMCDDFSKIFWWGGRILVGRKLG